MVPDQAQTKRASTLAKAIQMLPFMTIMTPRDARYWSDNFVTNVKKAWYRIMTRLGCTRVTFVTDNSNYH